MSSIQIHRGRFFSLLIQNTIFISLFHVFFLNSLLQAREWSVYLVVQAEGFSAEAKVLVDQIEQAVKSDTAGALKVCIDTVISKKKVERLVIERGVKKSIPCKAAPTLPEQIRQGAAWAFSDTAGERTAFIISGHGTGIVQPRYHAKKKVWMYERDDGSSPCKKFCGELTASFCQDVVDLMEGKSVVVSQGGSPFLAPDQIQPVISYIAGDLLKRKIDIIGFDSCYMAMLEIAYELKDSARYLVASQECEDKEGWHYGEVMHAFLSGSSTVQCARQCAYGYDRVQRKRGIERYCLSVFDLTYAHQLAKELDTVIARCLALDGEDILKAACAARVSLHKIAGVPFYADLGEFIELFLKELGDYKKTPALDGLTSSLLDVFALLQGLRIASVSGPMCMPLKGCSLYFPLAHIDSSYQGSFVEHHRWIEFLRWFTQDTRY